MGAAPGVSSADLKPARMGTYLTAGAVGAAPRRASADLMAARVNN